jgi:hypothetical protein
MPGSAAVFLPVMRGRLTLALSSNGDLRYLTEFIHAISREPSSQQTSSSRSCICQIGQLPEQDLARFVHKTF